jgi:hypothetical protein
MGMTGNQKNKRDQRRDELHISLDLLRKVKIIKSINNIIPLRALT